MGGETHYRPRVTVLGKEKVSVSGFADRITLHYLLTLLYWDYLHRILHRVVIADPTIKLNWTYF